MTAAIVVAAFALGLAVGLLLDTVIDRVPERQAVRPVRFRCRACPEGAADLPGLPVTAFLAPRRPCPVCGTPLAHSYWLVPWSTAVLYALVGLRFGPDWALPAYLVLAASLVAITVIDLRLQIIPNRIVYPTIFVGAPLLLLAALAEGDLARFGEALLGATLAWVALLVVHLISPRSMGFGDVRLSFVLGLFLAWISLSLVLTGLFLGFLLAAVVGGLLSLVRVTSLRAMVPFGPFLAAGALIAILAGDHLGPLALAT